MLNRATIRFSLVLALVLSVFLQVGCKKKGCTDPASLNYDPDAQVSDNSCTYPEGNGDVTLRQVGQQIAKAQALLWV